MQNLLARRRALDELAAELNCHQNEKHAQLRRANAIVKMLSLNPHVEQAVSRQRRRASVAGNYELQEAENLMRVSNRLEQLIGSNDATEVG